MDNIIKSVLNKFLKEAAYGIVYIDNMPCFLHFYSSCEQIMNDKFGIPVLNIRNFDVFFDSIKKYIIQTMDLKNLNDKKFKVYVEKRLLSLFMNATYNDFENPLPYIDRLIDFHKNKIFDNKINICDVAILDNSDITVCIQKQSFAMETPYVLKIQVQKELDGLLNKYDLPNISLGICDNTCYIYTLQQTNVYNNKYPNYTKKIKRLLYKVNEGLISDYDDELLSIDKVSPSAIISLSILFTLLEHININKIKVVPFLPMRYQNKDDNYSSELNYLLNSQPDEYKTSIQKEKLKEEYALKQLKIQNNLTQKLIMDFYRLQFHFNSIQIKSIPMELSDDMDVSINGELYTENIFLSQIIDKTRQSLQNKVK